MNLEIYKDTSLSQSLEKASLLSALSVHKLEANLGLNLKTNAKEEAFLLIKGKAILEFEGEEKELSSGDFFKIPPNSKFSILAIENIKFIRSSKTNQSQKRLDLGNFDRVELK